MKQLVLGLVVGVVACGGGGGGGGGAIDEEQAESVCTRGCEKDVECGDETSLELCVEDCVATFSGWARRDALETLVDCGVELACDADDDVCFAEVRPLAIHEEWEARCRTDFVTCLAEPDPEVCEVDFADPEAGDGAAFSFIAAPIMREIVTCLDEADCVGRQECIETILDEYGISL